MKRIVIVTGPPFGGKSTYVKEHMGPNDVVYDFDEMKAAVCLCNPHDEKNHARELLWDLRHQLAPGRPPLYGSPEPMGRTDYQPEQLLPIL